LETGCHYVAQAGLKHLDSNDIPASISEVPRTTGLNHCARLYCFILNGVFIYL
jgi:hypothetical protein